MAEAGHIRYLQGAAVDALRSNILTNLEKYKSSVAYWADELPEDAVLASSIPLAKPLSLEMPVNSRNNRDARNACTVYRAMPLTPQQATAEGIWVYLTHFDCRQYVRQRWPLDGAWNIQRCQRHISQHYFISGVRGRVRDNAISRLWWMAWIADRCTEALNCDLEYLLEVLLYRQDVRANLLERPGLSTSPKVFQAVMRHLLADYRGDKGEVAESQHSLFERDNFRKMMKQLSRIGGMVALNALEPDELNALVTDIVHKVKGYQ